MDDGNVEIMCIPNRLKFDSKLVDMISLSLLFLLPLMIISILYFRIGVSLWKSSNANMPSASASASVESSSSSGRCDSNAGLNGNQHNSTNPSQSYPGGRRDRKKSLVRQLNHYLPLPCIKGSGRKRHRRSSGSFYGSERPGYGPVTLTAINDMTGGAAVGNNCSPNSTNNTATTNNSRNVNGLLISCSNGGGSSLTPILKTSSLSQYTSPSPVVQQNHNGHQQCCSGCTSRTTNSRGSGCDSVPVSPYLMKRDSTPLSSPNIPSSINTEPIVLVKFEKKSSLRKCRRNQCTILMRPTNTALGEDGNGEGGCCKNGRNATGQGDYSSIITSTPMADEGGPYAEGLGTMGILSCQICDKNDPAILLNGGNQHEHFSTKLDGCDENVDDSHLVLKDSIQGPHQSLVHFGSGSPCRTIPVSCGANHHHYSASFKGPNSPANSTLSTIKGPKRMRIIRSSKYGTRALDARRRIIKMLIVIVVAFAICHLPLHARKIWQYWGKGYKAGSVFSSLFTPITFLIQFAQSGINPILYAFMSRKFRNSFADLLCCNMRRSFKMSRNLSVRSTNAVQLSQTA